MIALLRLPLALGILTLFSPGADEPGIEHSSGLAYEMRTTRTMSMRSGQAHMYVDGQGLPTETWKVGTWVPDRDDVETVVLRDVVQQVEEGRPVRVVREIVELSMQVKVLDETTERTGVLEGEQLTLERTAEGTVEARFTDDEEHSIDAVFLDGHRLEHDIHRFMPEEPVEAGDSWKPDDDAVRALLIAPGPQYYDKNAAAELPGLLEKAAEITAEMTLRERVMLDGVECWRLELEVAMQADVDALPAEFSTGDEREDGSFTVESTHHGELWIGVASRFPVKLEFESEWTFDLEIDIEADELSFQFKLEFTANNTSSREWEILE
ncbi:MAG: hypothetical protein KDC14_15255 [Planctomycetes bacterium]|nr:hypothetical protein [Planctomycetota bacterium]